MNDLNQIVSNNSKAGAADAAAQRNNGKFVVTTYAGLSYLGHSVFDTNKEAEDHAAAIAVTLPVGERVLIQPPLAPYTYVPSGDAPATLASLDRDHKARVAHVALVTSANLEANAAASAAAAATSAETAIRVESAAAVKPAKSAKNA